MDIKELKIETQSTKRNHPWEHARFKAVCKLVKKEAPTIDPRRAIIDIGCGDIFFLSNFYRKHQKWEPIAVDLAFDETVIAQLKESNADVPIAFYNHLDKVPATTKAGLIFLMDVIEHIENDKEFLTELTQKEIIDSNTRFLITVPAFNSLFSNHDRWLGHYRRYSLKSLKRTIEDSGFTCIMGGYFFTSLLLPRAIGKTLESKSSTEECSEKGIGDWNGSRFTSMLIEKVLLCDFYCTQVLQKFGIVMPGLSTYVLCKIKKK